MSTSTRKVNPRQTPKRATTVSSGSAFPSWFKWVALLGALVILISAGAFARSQKGLIAVVGGKHLTQDDYAKLAAYFKTTDPEMNLADYNTQNDIYYYLILNASRMQLAQDQNITVSAEEAEEEYNSRVLPLLEVSYLIDEGYKQEVEFNYFNLYYATGDTSEEDRKELEEILGTTGRQLYTKALEDAGLTEAEYKVFVRENMIFNALNEAINETFTVTDEEIAAVYEEGKEGRFGTKRGLSHILLKTVADDNTTPLSDEEISDKASTAHELLRKLREEEADFASLAKEYSEDTGSAAQGGYIGEYTQSDLSSGQLVANFAAKSAELTEVGQLSEVVNTEYGYHVIRLDSITEQTLESVSETIKSEITKEKASAARKELLKKVDVRPVDLKDALLSIGW